MTSIKETLASDMKQAMLDKDIVRKDVLRMLRAAIQRREVDERIVDLARRGVVFPVRDEGSADAAFRQHALLAVERIVQRTIPTRTASRS